MEAEFGKPHMVQLQRFLQQEWAGREAIFPPQPLIFRAYNAVPLDAVRVVILGQDPYHGPGQAVGLCFSVPPEAKRPSSLLNIYKELASDCGCRIVPHGNLEAWAAQGGWHSAPCCNLTYPHSHHTHTHTVLLYLEMDTHIAVTCGCALSPVLPPLHSRCLHAQYRADSARTPGQLARQEGTPCHA